MKPYGIGRYKELEHPGLRDIRAFGLKSVTGNLPGPGGDIKNSIRSAENKAAIRRYWKRKARVQGAKECNDTDKGEYESTD